MNVVSTSLLCAFLELRIMVQEYPENMKTMSELNLKPLATTNDFDLCKGMSSSASAYKRGSEVQTLKPICLSLSASTSRRPSKTNAGFVMSS